MWPHIQSFYVERSWTVLQDWKTSCPQEGGRTLKEFSSDILVSIRNLCKHYDTLQNLDFLSHTIHGPFGLDLCQSQHCKDNSCVTKRQGKNHQIWGDMVQHISLWFWCYFQTTLPTKPSLQALITAQVIQPLSKPIFYT